jgi:hypothetical protein
MRKWRATCARCSFVSGRPRTSSLTRASKRASRASSRVVSTRRWCTWMVTLLAMPLLSAALSHWLGLVGRSLPVPLVRVVGGGSAIAELLFAGFALEASTTRIDQAADPDDVADLVLADRGADLSDPANHFMARNHGKQLPRKLPRDTAKENVEENVVRARIAAADFQRADPGGRALRAIGFGTQHFLLPALHPLPRHLAMTARISALEQKASEAEQVEHDPEADASIGDQRPSKRSLTGQVNLALRCSRVPSRLNDRPHVDAAWSCGHILSWHT